MLLNFTKGSLVQIYERNERQKERVKCTRDRLAFIQLRMEQQEAALEQLKSSRLSRNERKTIELLEPYFQQQAMIHECIRDELITLGDMLEESTAEHNSILSWLDFSESDLAIYHRMDDRRNLLRNADFRVVQVCTHLRYGDAIGNDVLTIQRALDEEGIATGIYAGSVCEQWKDAGIAFSTDDLMKLGPEDILIYHASVEDPFSSQLALLKCKVIIRYHNITPPEFYVPYSEDMVNILEHALLQMKKIRGSADYVMADSEYNKQDLVDMKYTCGMSVVPILIPFADYDQEPDIDVMRTYDDDWINILFVGRGAPNKRIEDIIDAYAAYKRIYNDKVRLILVGDYKDGDEYVKSIHEKLDREKICDVIFPGHISFAEVLAFYKVADVFLCMSEHEGFCVPLLEAMYLQVPIIAYNSTAVPYTLQDAGILMGTKQPEKVAEQIHGLLESEDLQKSLIDKGLHRLEDFGYDAVKKRIMESIQYVRDMVHK